MSRIPLPRPQEAIITIAKKLLAATGLCLCSFDTQDGMVVIAGDRGTAAYITKQDFARLFSSQDPYLHDVSEGTPRLALKLDDDIFIFATLSGALDDDKLTSTIPALTVCAKAVLCSATSKTRRPDLPDRLSLNTHIDQMIALSLKSETGRRLSFSVIEIDLDRLNALNLRHGWETANLVVDLAISRVQSALPEKSLLAYAGGSNILVVTPPATSVVLTRTLIASLRAALDIPFEIEDEEVRPSFSMGWAVYPDDGAGSETLLRAVDAAIAEARRLGGAHERRATMENVATFIGTTQLERDLTNAAERGELALNWMPIISPGSQTVVALEALLRWNRAVSGPVPTELFIQCAENAGLIESLDEWSLRNACSAALNWSHPLRVCVNVSPTWLANRRLSTIVQSILDETGLQPERLQIELSEKRSFGPRDIAYQELSRLRALGVHVALDDFGAGYSSLERLANFPVDQIKFDRSFMMRLNDDRRVNEVLTHTIQMARRLGISCCAKGVETERQMAFFDSQGCDEVQGYLLGIPVADYL